MPNINVTAKLKGPFFGANLNAWMDAAAQDAKEAVAQEAVDLMHIQLDRVLKNPTGYYRSHIQKERQGKDWHVHDDNVVYGGWLEGVSSRNQSTRFKGYHSFRLVLQDIRKVAIDIAAKVFSQHVDRLNR